MTVELGELHSYLHTFPVLLIPPGHLFWVRSWQLCRQMPPLCFGLWVIGLADHSMGICSTVSDKSISITGSLQRTVLSFLPSFLPPNPLSQTSAIIQSCVLTSLVTLVSNQGHSVDIVEDYKYIGVFLDNKLDWTKTTKDAYKKDQSHLTHCLHPPQEKRPLSVKTIRP